MAITENECRTGGKICKQPLRRVPFTPYNRPPPAARGICRPPQANVARGRSRWFSKLVDSTARVVVSSVSRLFSAVFGKSREEAPSGENITAIKEVPAAKSSFDVREQGESFIDITLSIRYDGSETSKQEIISHIEDIFQLEQQVNQIHEEHFETPIEITGAYLGSRPQKATPIIELQRKICRRNKAWFGNKLANTTISSKSALSFHATSQDSQNKYMSLKCQSRSTLYKLARSPYFGSSMMTNSMKYGPYKDNTMESSRITNWITSPINIMNFGHKEALKRSSSNRDIECYDSTRRVRQKSCMKDLNSFEEQKQSTELEKPSNLNYKIPLACDLYTPPQSTERAKKILYELNK